MRHSLRRTTLLAVALAPLGGCGAEPTQPIGRGAFALDAEGECLIGDETLEHACLHANHGPYASVAAQPYPGFVFSDINAPHTAYTIELPEGGSGFSGAVLYQPTASGEVAFLLSEQMDVALYDSLGVLMVPEGTSEGDDSICPQLSQVVVYTLGDTEAYTLALASEAVPAPLLIAEYLGQEASCETSCEPVTLVASRTYHPAAWEDAELAFEHPIVFEIPRKLVVTEGNAGDHLAMLTVSAEGDSFVCRYRGNGHKRYVFQRCSNGAQPGDDAEAEHLRVHVKRGGNDGPNQRTTVELTIQPECEDHGHEHESEGE